MTSILFWIILAIYVLVGVYVSKFIKGTVDYYVMGEKAPTILIVGTLSATYLSAVTLLGIAGAHYSQGPLVISTLGSFGAWLGTMIAVFYIGREFKALKCRTMPDFFQRRFKSKWVTAVATIIMIVGLLGYGIIQLMGAGLVLSEVTGISYTVIIVAFTFALLIFTYAGGMWGVVVTDTLMLFTMFIIAAVISPLLVSSAGGIENIVTTTVANFGTDYWTLGGLSSRPLGWSISQFLVWILFFACTPALVSRVFPAKNDFVLLKGGIIGVFLAPFLQIMPYVLGASAMAVIQPGITPPDRVLIVGFFEHMPMGLGAFGLAGIMAAIMSTTSTLFVLTGFGLARDLYENLINPGINEKQRMNVARLSQVVLAIIVVLISISRPPAIYWISIYAGAIFAVGWLPTVVAGLQWRKMTNEAAMASMISGVLSFIAITELSSRGFITLPVHIDALMIGIVVSVAALFIGAYFSKPTAGNLEYFEEIKRTRLSDVMVAEVRDNPVKLEALKKEYKSTYNIAIGFIVIAVVLWGYLGIQFARPLM